jgi:hypothetical protein
MPVRPLPPNPNFEHLKDEVEDLARFHAARDPQAAQRIREFHPRFAKAPDHEIFAAAFPLRDAEFTIACERGFPTWARLKHRIENPVRADDLSLPHHERIEDPAFRRAVDLLDAGDAEGLRAHLNAHPRLSHQHVLFEGGNYFRNPTLLEFIAENPIRRGALPANIAAVATEILDAGAKNNQSALDGALGLVCSGCVPRQCGVQIPLIDLLCAYGARIDNAVSAAIGEGEFEAVQALIRNGAQMTLPVAAALGRLDDVHRTLPQASSEDRHRALALSSRFGHTQIVRILLDAGEDPNRYNPVGCHSHSTPLHQAALAGHADVVRLLVERDARLDLKDIFWQGTPAGWAQHGARTEIEKYLRSRE